MKAMMVLGTSSNAGKSFITAGILRVLKQDGYKVCPFKSQNMALNSYITQEGHEIGRAQAMQAEAAGIKPSVYMNPILLKPNSDTGSQVIIKGKAVGNMTAKEYFARKKEYIPHIKAAYEALAKEYEVCIVEGAGSPAEINLKENDIVNMGLADIIDCNAILVGDIDRGGVFASLYGTVELLEEREKARIRGLLINKFRGDVRILEPGLRMIESRLGKKVLGAVPMAKIDVADEDSLSGRLYGDTKAGVLDIAVVHLPHISNFTDFDPFSRFAGISLRYVREARDFGSPDLVILPGTKNTGRDLLHIRQNGIEALIQKHAAAGRALIGICGGYQMLGQSLEDPYGVESGLHIEGMKLLPAKTTFAREKRSVQTKAVFCRKRGLLAGISPEQVEGYEIHMGKTEALGGAEWIYSLGGGLYDGLMNERGNVFGTYLHGLFDNEVFCHELLQGIAAEKGLSLDRPPDRASYIEREYDKLADLIRRHVDMQEIYRIIGL